MVEVKVAFQDVSNDFWSLLVKKFVEHNFTDKQVLDSCDNVIKNCIYPKPTIAQFLSFDKKQKLYSYNEALNLSHVSGMQFEAIKIDGKPFWVEK